MAIEVVPPSIERIDVVELEPEVIAANRRVADGRWRDPLSHPRVHVHLNDARNALSLVSSRFDVIVSQPSHPWAGGAPHLYTREFYALVKSRLAPDGAFLQWIGLPFAKVLQTLGELVDVLDSHRTSSHAFVFRARVLARTTAADYAELASLRTQTLRRLGVNVPRGASRKAER